MAEREGERANRATVAAARIVDADSRARTHLANERTFLAWLRTGLSLVALGLAVAHFLEPSGQTGRTFPLVVGAVLVASGTLMTASGGVRFVNARNEIEAGTFHSRSLAVVLSVLLAAAAGVAALAYIVVVR